MKIIASYILNSFYKSQKKHLLITGKQKGGKTLLFNELKLMLSPDTHALISYKEDNYVYMSDGIHRDIIGCKNENNTYYGQPMNVIKDGFYTIGIPFIKKAILDYDWICIDEIGFLESEELDFQNQIKEAMDFKRVLAVLRKQDLSFLNELKDRNDVFIADLDLLATRFGCIIMASGMSQRYGSNKLFEVFNGKSFFENVLELTENLFYHRVVVTRDLDVKHICENRGIEVVYHDFPYRNQAICLGINRMNDVNNCMFIPCDQPMLKRESIISMLKESIEYNGIIRLCYENKVGSPVLFDKRYFEELKCLPDKKGGNYIVKQYESDVKFVECEHELELFDVDTKEDFYKIIEK